MEAILIKFPDKDHPHFTVAQGNKYRDGLDWSEMLEQVIGLTHHRILSPTHPMKSRQLQDAEKAFHEAHIALSKAQKSELIGLAIRRAVHNQQEVQPSPVADTAAKEAVKSGQSGV